MKCIFAIGLSLAGAAVVAAAMVSAQSAPTPTLGGSAGAAALESYELDSVHSTVAFRINHMGVAPFYGRFNTIGGEFTFDESAPESATFNITIPTESVDSGNEQRDRHLKTADFFNAREFPEITFKSTSVAAAEDGSLDVTGDLTLHGVTKSVTVKAIPVGAKETQQGYKRGFEVQAAINRSDFGMEYGLEGDVLGDEIALRFGLEGARK